MSDGDADDPPPARRPWWRWVVNARVGIAVVVLFGLIQFVPYRIQNHPVVAEPKWDSPKTRELAVRACFNCHSNQTEKPWYSQVAPISWWTTNHVNGGRSNLNFSDWRADSRKTREVVESLREGSMPPSYYTWFGLHSEAKLTPEETAALMAGLQKSLA